MSFRVDDEGIHVTFKIGQTIDTQEGLNFVGSNQCGAINLFLGTIRDEDQSYNKPIGCLDPVESIYYDAYESMARKQILEIIQRTVLVSKLPDGDNSRVFVAIRLGEVPVGQASILICVSSSGRKFSHDATMTILNQIKANVVIWKQIVFADGHREWASEKRSEAFWLRDTSVTKN